MVEKAISCLIFALMALSALVFGMILAGLSAWGVIATYWAVLTLKNALDWWRMKQNKGQ